MSISKRWNEPQGESITGKLFERLKPQDPLKPRIEETQHRLQMQLSKLEAICSKLKEKDKLIFNKVIHSLQSHDSYHAKILSSELSQVRKMGKMVSSAKLALEQIHLRLNTMTELGDVVVTLSPAMSVIKGIQGGLSSMIPEVDQSFGQISDLLGGIMNESGQIPTAEIGQATLLNEESIKILE